MSLAIDRTEMRARMVDHVPVPVVARPPALRVLRHEWSDIHPRPGSPLTPRELEVLRMLATGDTQAMAAYRLGVSPKTIKVHLYRAYQRLETESLVGAFVKLGWLAVP